MYTDNRLQADSVGRHLTLLREYIDTVENLFPALSRRTLNSLSISSADALLVGLFLDYYPHRTVVFESGVKLGTSTFLLAHHPKVSRVVGVDRNPLIAEEAPNGDHNDDTGTPENLKALDAARAALAEHAVASQKIELRESVEGAAEADFPSEEGLIFLANDPRGRREVSGELEAIFGRHPQAIALLGNCRRSPGPFVQAGIADFMEEARDDYHFRLAGDLGFGLAGSSFGVVYPDEIATGVSEVLGEIGRQFSERLDPLRLLQREEELIENATRVDRNPNQAQRVNELEKRNDELNKQISSLTRQIEHLNHHYSSRRYKLADAAMDRVQRLKALKRLVQ